MKKTYIVDHSNMVYRFKNTYKFAKVDVNGISFDFSALYGYVRALKANFYDDIMICVDGFPSLSKSILPSYKGQRLHDPDESLSISSLELVQFLTKVGSRIGKNIKVLASPGQEADQVISSLVYLYSNNAPTDHEFLSNLKYGFDPVKAIDSDCFLKKYAKGVSAKVTSQFDSTSIIASTDSDMFQLMRFENVFMDSSTAGRNILPRDKTPKAVKGLHPQSIPAYKMIVGDISDNVPKVCIPGYSEDTLIKIIRSQLNTTEKLDVFLEEMRKRVFSQVPELARLQKVIYKHDLTTQLFINYKVTCLAYYSTPLELQYPSYSIDETINKFHLSL